MKRMISITFLGIILLGVSSGCQRDLPKPDKKPKSITEKAARLQRFEILPVLNPNSNDFPSLFARHQIRGNQVLIECIVNGISFRQAEESNDRKGKMVVWVDGKKNGEFNQAAFIIKGVPPGKHKIKLEMVDLRNISYGLVKEFMVNIPN